MIGSPCRYCAYGFAWQYLYRNRDGAETAKVFPWIDRYPVITGRPFRKESPVALQRDKCVSKVLTLNQQVRGGIGVANLNIARLYGAQRADGDGTGQSTEPIARCHEVRFPARTGNQQRASNPAKSNNVLTPKLEFSTCWSLSSPMVMTGFSLQKFHMILSSSCPCFINDCEIVRHEIGTEFWDCTLV